ncbi:MAG TPA: cation diffusion facilitator family transporter [Steroidobacteraceae bacterium]|nr:cation diffusion facilitator family transporter [Steroidobacteraceae bacterium]
MECRSEHAGHAHRGHGHARHGHDSHGHGHAHHPHAGGHGGAQDSRSLFWAFALTGGFALVELAGGLYANSLTLLADAGHMLTDAGSLALAWLALRFANLPSDRRRTYGYQRLQVLAAFVNSLLLLAAVVWLVIESIERLRNPSPVSGVVLLAIAGGGLIVNLAALTFLRRGDSSNLNLRAAYLHVVSDALGSVAALAAGAIVMATGWMQIDPVLALLVAALIVRSAWSLLKQSAHILLEGTPDWLDIDELQRELRESVAGVIDVHHVHVWCITTQQPLVTLHAHVQPDAATATVLAEIKQFLAARYGLDHSTIQLEPADCADTARAAI